MPKLHKAVKKPLIAIAGGVVLVVGIVMIPYPGPGWIVVFAGLAILASEFTWAQKILDKAKGFYDAWQVWLKRQNLVIRVLILAATGLIVLLTIWLLDVFGMIDSLLKLHYSWLHSPIFGS